MVDQPWHTTAEGRYPTLDRDRYPPHAEQPQQQQPPPQTSTGDHVMPTAEAMSPLQTPNQFGPWMLPLGVTAEDMLGGAELDRLDQDIASRA